MRRTRIGVGRPVPESALRSVGRPFLVTGSFMLVQAVLFETVASTRGWPSAFLAIGRLPMLPTLLLTFVAAAAVSWFGWRAGTPSKRRSV